MVIQHLANHPFHNWFNPIALLHSDSEAIAFGKKGASPSILLIIGLLANIPGKP
jgi:hypothetical protein